MAEAMNYRMNLVIDPKNVIKANRELRAMERYFERIQGRVLRIGRTRMAPEIVLKDSASKGLDNLLDKMQRVKSQVIQASANVRLDVQKQINTNLNLNVQKQIETSVKVDMQAFGLDFSPLTQALQANTDALNQLTSTLGSLDFSGGGGKKSGWDTALNFFAQAAFWGGAVRGGAQLKGKYKDIRGSGNKSAENKPAETKSIGNKSAEKKTDIVNKDKKNGKNNVIPFPKTAATPETKKVSKPKIKLGGFWNKTEKIGDLVETVGVFGQGAVKALNFVWDGAKNIFGGGGGNGIVSGGIGSVAKSGAGLDTAQKAATGSVGASVAKSAGKSGLGSGLMKTIGKRALGPLGYIADATAIASAEPGKERNQAIGSAVGGGIGSAIGGFFGSVIPVAGTLVGSTIGGTLGSLAGEKLGGFITDVGEKFTETKEKVSKWFSNTFSFGKKDKEAAQQKDVPKSPPSSPTVARIPDPIIRKPSSVQFSKPLLPDPALYGSYVPPSHSSSSGTFGPPASAARNQAMAGNPSPQSVQISPEQMSMFSGYFKDFKTETTVNYNLPSGAVQVTVHEEHPVDVEGLILLIGQRLRAEMTKVAQNRKPSPMAY